MENVKCFDVFCVPWTKLLDKWLLFHKKVAHVRNFSKPLVTTSKYSLGWYSIFLNIPSYVWREKKIKGTVHSQHSTFLFFSSNSLNAKSLNYFSRKKSYTFNHNSLKQWLIQPLQKWLPIATQQFFSLPLSISIEDSLVTENGRTIEVWSCISTGISTG